MKKLLVALLFATTASAGFLVEPYLGYSLMGSGEQGNDEYESSGLVVGGRVGYSMLGLMGGIDYNMSSYDLEMTKDGDSAANSDKGDKSGVSQNNLGIFAGYQFPIFLRVWVSYYLSSSMEFDKTDIDVAQKDDKLKGGGYALGVGYTGLPFVSINLEYKKYSYDEYEDNTAGKINLPSAASSAIGARGEYDHSEIMLGVSLPFDL